jgi:hypothetical protein
VPSELLRGRDLASDNDKLSQHEKIREQAAWGRSELAKRHKYPDTKLSSGWTWSTACSMRFRRCCRIRDDQNPLELAMRLPPGGWRSQKPLLEHVTSADPEENK